MTPLLIRIAFEFNSIKKLIYFALLNIDLVIKLFIVSIKGPLVSLEPGMSAIIAFNLVCSTKLGRNVSDWPALSPITNIS